MGITARISVAAFCLMDCLLQAQVQRFVISQAHPQLPTMNAFVDVLDANGRVPADLTPGNFSATLGNNTVNVRGVRPFEGSGQGVAYAFLVDISKSISTSDFALIQDAIRKWIESLKSADRAAVCTFGDQYTVVTDFTNDKQKLSSAVLNLAPRSLQTHLYEAVRDSMNFEQRTDSDLPARRVVVVMSDGKDEGSAITSGDVVHDLRIGHLPIYAIGYSHLAKGQRQQYLDVLRRFAELSGGVYEDASASNLEQIYASVQQAVLRVLILDLSCPPCSADGRSYPLQITLSQSGRSLTGSLDVIPSKASPGVQIPRVAFKPNIFLTVWASLPQWLWILLGIAAAAMVILAGLAIQSRKPAERKAEIALAVGSPASSSSTTLPLPSKQATKNGLSMQLAVVAGKEKGRIYQLHLGKTLVIGRAQDCDLVLNDPRISKRHAELELSKSSVVIYDLDSRNSTYVNGVPIQGRHKLDDQDTLLIGETELRLRFDKDEILAG